MDKIVDPQFRRFAIFLVITFFGLGYSLTTLPGISPPPPNLTFADRTCITGFWKFCLILTHCITFILIPVAMKVFYTSLNAMGRPFTAIFASQLGLAFIMASIGSEIGWHVTQCWYYQDNFTMLNFMFYFFLLSAFALWADGLVKEDTPTTDLWNIVFCVLLLLSSFSYPIGAKTGNGWYKVPFFISLLIIFCVLTYRGYELLETYQILYFPLLSVVVNLFFVYLLQAYGGNQYYTPKVFRNALFHILHDLLGTLLGVAIFAYLVYIKGAKVDRDSERVPLVG